MGVVIVQSKATAHVYRMFAALVALLLMMAITVGVMRLRADRSMTSPYGALGTVAPVAALPPDIVVVPARVAAQATPQTAAAVLAAADPAPSPRALAFAPQPPAAPPQVTAPPTPAPASASVAASMAAAVHAPTPDAAPAVAAPQATRSIALDRAAARAAVPQPAPPEAVEAATRMAAASPPAADPRQIASARTPADPAANAEAASAQESRGGAGRININTASIDQLNNIPGGGRIGRMIARHRPYRSLEDLVEHRVLKARDFARIRSAISTD